MASPLPRFRIYSKAEDYRRVFFETVFGGTLRGDDCQRLENRVLDYTGSPFAVCTAKARVAIYLALEALLENRPKKVVLSPYTISDVVNMVLCAGGIPVFADLEADTCNVSANEIEQLLDDDTGAVLVTHLHGLACDIRRISQICKDREIPLVEDAAQAFGTKVDGQSVGTFGDAGAFSFGMYKNLNSFFGGMLVTRHAWLDQKIRARTEHMPPQEMGYFLRKVTSGVATDAATYPPLFSAITFPIFRFALRHDIGFLNSQVSVDASPTSKDVLPESYLRRMRPLQARLSLSKIDGVDADISARLERAKKYSNGLSGIAEIGLPPLPGDRSHTYSYYPIRVPDRDKLVRHLMEQGRDVAKQHLKNCADLDCFASFYRDCPVSRATAEEVVLLPTYPRYEMSEIDQNIAAICAYYGETNP